MDAGFMFKIALVADNPGAVQKRAPVIKGMPYY
jgi:hypothetical protein